jgi:hypothetical protein
VFPGKVHYSAHGNGQTANQLAPAFGCAPINGYRYAIYSERTACRNDLVHPMWLTAGVELWAVDLITKASNRASTNVIGRRAANDGAAVIGFVADRDYY